MTTENALRDLLASGSTAEQMENRDRRIVRELAKLMGERCAALGLKGKKADAEALAFWLGAASLCELIGDKVLYNRLGMQAALIISVRGMMGVRELAADHAANVHPVTP